MNALKSFSKTYLAFIRGEISEQEIRESVICVNCEKKHALPEKPKHVAKEVLRLRELRGNSIEVVEEHLVAIGDLPKEIAEKATRFHELMWNAYWSNKLYICAHRVEE